MEEKLFTNEQEACKTRNSIANLIHLREHSIEKAQFSAQKLMEKTLKQHIIDKNYEIVTREYNKGFKITPQFIAKLWKYLNELDEDERKEYTQNDKFYALVVSCVVFRKDWLVDFYTRIHFHPKSMMSYLSHYGASIIRPNLFRDILRVYDKQPSSMYDVVKYILQILPLAELYQYNEPKSGRNMLHILVMHGDLKLMKLMAPSIFKLEDVNQSLHDGVLDGYTPYKLALVYNKNDIADFLLKNGAVAELDSDKLKKHKEPQAIKELQTSMCIKRPSGVVIKFGRRHSDLNLSLEKDKKANSNDVISQTTPISQIKSTKDSVIEECFKDSSCKIAKQLPLEECPKVSKATNINSEVSSPKIGSGLVRNKSY